MKVSNQDQAGIRDYLLGHLNDEDQQRLEERLMVDDDLFEEFEMSKGDLIEKYCAGELKRKENQWLETHYLLSPEGNQRYTFEIALNCINRPSPQPDPPTWFERLVSLFKQKRWAFATVTPVLMAVVALLVVYPRFLGPKQTLSVALETSTFHRAPSNLQYRRIQLTSDVWEVKFDLKLPDSITTSRNYRAVLDDRSGTTKTLNVNAGDARSLSIVIPASDLHPGLYALELSAINDNGGEQRIGDYFFEVSN